MSNTGGLYSGWSLAGGNSGGQDTGYQGGLGEAATTSNEMGSTPGGQVEGLGALPGQSAGNLSTTDYGAMANQGAYQNQINQYNQSGQAFGQQGNAALGIQGPQIQGPSQAGLNSTMGQMGALYNQYGQLAQGKGALATSQDNQLRSAQTQAANTQTALGNSAMGGAIGQAAAGRQAQEQRGMMGASNVASADALKAQQQQAGLAGEASVANAMGSQAQSQYAQNQALFSAQAALNQQQRGQNEGYANALYGNQYNQQQMAAGQTNAYTGENVQATLANAGLGVQQQQATNTMINSVTNAGGAGASAISGLAGGYSSDEGLKEDVDDHSNLADEFLRRLSPKSYRYKNMADEPRQPGTGGRYLGVMAQDVESTPEIGKQIIINTPRGKMVSHGAAMSAALAGLGRLHERLADLEGDK
jgi:Chaperone of endosialidase